ncbi:MAG: cell wall hydrolase [Ruminococcus flavefaciens]|nr:cell wall hydrolase [Ruminococcus flavefaciens]
MSKGKTAVCVCAMVASCITGCVLIADCAVSGNMVGKMNNQEVFGFENQKLANTMPTFTEPIGENTEFITADTEYYTEEVPAMNQECIVDVMTKELTTIYTEVNTTETVLTQEAVTSVVSDVSYTDTENSPAVAEEAEEIVTTTAVAITTTTTTTTTTETTTTTTTTEFTEPAEWFYMETTTALAYEEPVYEEPAVEEYIVEESVYTEPEVVDTYVSGLNYISESDYILLCNAVAHEAGSDWIDIYSKANVVEVIMNRVYSPLFPNTVYEVLTQPYQFEGSETYTYLGGYSYEVTDSVISAVDLYFSDPYSFSQGYLYFFGDGYQNYFSVSQ